MSAPWESATPRLDRARRLQEKDSAFRKHGDPAAARPWLQHFAISGWKRNGGTGSVPSLNRFWDDTEVVPPIHLSLAPGWAPPLVPLQPTPIRRCSGQALAATVETLCRTKILHRQAGKEFQSTRVA